MSMRLYVVNDVVYAAGMCPQWSAVVATNHHSDKIATATNSLTSTKISPSMKMFSLNSQLLYTTRAYVCMYIVSARNLLDII